MNADLDHDIDASVDLVRREVVLRCKLCPAQARGRTVNSALAQLDDVACLPTPTRAASPPAGIQRIPKHQRLRGRA